MPSTFVLDIFKPRQVYQNVRQKDKLKQCLRRGAGQPLRKIRSQKKQITKTIFATGVGQNIATPESAPNPPAPQDFNIETLSSRDAVLTGKKSPLPILKFGGAGVIDTSLGSSTWCSKVLQYFGQHLYQKGGVVRKFYYRALARPKY